MKIKRKDCEDTENTDELFAAALTEDLIAWLREMDDAPVGLETKADVYNLILERQSKGIEI